MTYRGGRAVRAWIVALVGSAGIVVLFTPGLDAPGPPEMFIEPQTEMVLVAIEPGTFQMGSQPGEPGRGDDETPHRVTLTRRIYMGRHEVTQTEWAVIMRNNPSHFQGCGRCPVENVNLFEVGEFIAGLNAQATSVRYRLPTEAEWEYACRAGDTTPFESGKGLGTTRTVPVGQFAPNAWGLYDMHGNVREWTNDRYGAYDLSASADPRGAPGGTLHVVRGGSWHLDAERARCSSRATFVPQDKGSTLGFRVVAEASPRRSLDLGGYRNR